MGWFSDLFGGGSDNTAQYQQQAYSQGAEVKSRYARDEGITAEMGNIAPEFQDAFQAGYWDAHAKKVEGEKIKMMFEGMMESMAASNSAQAAGYAQMQADQNAAAEEARLGGLRNTRDAHISNYFSAANDATSYVSDKIAGEKANAALMGVDYNMTDDIKSERISNYFSGLWSEGNQAELEGSFAEVGAGDFEQTMWRGEGTEAGPAGEVGEQKSGGGITPKATKKTLIDEDENQLGATSILGA